VVVKKRRWKTLYRSELSIGGRNLRKYRARATTPEVTVASLSVPEVRTSTCTRRVCALGVCRNVPYPCVQRRTVTHRIVVYVRYPDDLSGAFVPEIRRCQDVAARAMENAARALLPVLVTNPQTGLGGVLAAGAAAFTNCLASGLRSQVQLVVGYRRSASDWRAASKRKRQ